MVEAHLDLAREIAQTRPDAIYFGGAEGSNALRLWRDLDEAVPEALLDPQALSRRGLLRTAGLLGRRPTR